MLAFPESHVCYWAIKDATAIQVQGRRTARNFWDTVEKVLHIPFDGQVVEKAGTYDNEVLRLVSNLCRCKCCTYRCMSRCFLTAPTVCASQHAINIGWAEHKHVCAVCAASCVFD